jgi:hypothetical protein
MYNLISFSNYNFKELDKVVRVENNIVFIKAIRDEDYGNGIQYISSILLENNNIILPDHLYKCLKNDLGEGEYIVYHNFYYFEDYEMGDKSQTYKYDLFLSNFGNIYQMELREKEEDEEGDYDIYYEYCGLVNNRYTKILDEKYFLLIKSIMKKSLEHANDICGSAVGNGMHISHSDDYRVFMEILNILLNDKCMLLNNIEMIYKKKKIDELNKKIKDLETQIKFMPGNEGYQDALENFNKLANKIEN